MAKWRGPANRPQWFMLGILCHMGGSVEWRRSLCSFWAGDKAYGNQLGSLGQCLGFRSANCQVCANPDICQHKVRLWGGMFTSCWQQRSRMDDFCSIFHDFSHYLSNEHTFSTWDCTLMARQFNSTTFHAGINSQADRVQGAR